MVDTPLQNVRQWYDDAAQGYDARQAPSCKRFQRIERLLVDVAVGERILDLGCGTGRLLSKLRNPEAIGIDLSMAMLRQGESKNIVQADGHHLPFADESFDAVVSGQAVMRYMRTEEAFREIRRVLRPGGRCAVHQYGNAWSLKRLLGKEAANPLSLGHPDELRVPARRAGLRSLRTQLWRGIRVYPHVIRVPESLPGAWWNHCILVFERPETWE